MATIDAGISQQTQEKKIENKVDFNRKSVIESNFKPLKKYEDSRFGQVTIIEVPNNHKKLMVREKTFNNQKELETEIRAAERRIAIHDPHLVALVDYSTGSKSDFCSSVHWIKLYFEFPDHDVEQELRRRNRDNIVGYTGAELTHMLYQTIHAGAVLNKGGMYQGDICPQTIEMDSPDSYKLVERFGDLASPEEFHQAKIMSGGEVYSAPEVYARIKQGKGKTALKGSLPAKSMMTADVFSLGMTILHAATDDGVQSVYQKDGQINVEVLEKLKSKFSGKFPDNSLLVSTVYAMLEQDSTRRPPDFVTMEKELPPYAAILPALEAEKRRIAIQTPGYNQYVSQAAWEQNWSKTGLTAHQQHPAPGILGGLLKPVQTNSSPHQSPVIHTQGESYPQQGGHQAVHASATSIHHQPTTTFSQPGNTYVQGAPQQSFIQEQTASRPMTYTGSFVQPSVSQIGTASFISSQAQALPTTYTTTGNTPAFGQQNYSQTQVNGNYTIGNAQFGNNGVVGRG